MKHIFLLNYIIYAHSYKYGFTNNGVHDITSSYILQLSLNTIL